MMSEVAKNALNIFDSTYKVDFGSVTTGPLSFLHLPKPSFW